MYTDSDVNKFDLLERLKLVEAVVQNEAKGGKKDFQGVNSVNMFCCDFFDGVHIALDFNNNFKEGKKDRKLFLKLQLSMSII